MSKIDFKRFADPFPADDVEWRIAQKGVGRNDKPWAKVLAYITNRAIMQRLDDVAGPENWKNEFVHIEGAFLCGLSIKIDGEWVTKWDGAQESQIEATKGGLSGAMKRAAVQWGIGRYLYGLDEGFAEISDNGRFYSGRDQRNNIPAFKWNPPKLPAWALPQTTDRRKEEKRGTTDVNNHDHNTQNKPPRQRSNGASVLSQEEFEQYLPVWKGQIKEGRRTVQGTVDAARDKGINLTKAQVKQLEAA